MDIAQLIQTIAIYALPVIFAITVHEAAHGYVARYFGDNTAWALGRVTLNPMKHIDLVGTILMPVLLYVATAGTFLFGYAKPVPVRFGNLRKPKQHMVWVALAGPGANFLQALLWGALLYFVNAAGPEAAVPLIVDLVKNRIPNRFGFDPIRDVQVLCPMNRGGVGARSLNIELQAALNPAKEQKVERFGWTFAPGDKVMQIENDYEKEVYNGDVGYIVKAGAIIPH